MRHEAVLGARQVPQARPRAGAVPVDEALFGFHVGTKRRLITEGYGGHRFRLHAQRRPVEVVSSALVDAGSVVEAEVVQDPRGPVVNGRVLARRT